MAKNTQRTTVTIPNSQNKAGLKFEGNRTFLGFITPATLTGTTFSFEASIDANGTEYKPIYKEGTLYSVTVGTSRYVAVDPSVFHGVTAMNIVSGATEAGARQVIIVSGEVT